ncbi:hypothetical protein LIA77_02225 [Sarocladium implicatum]|nr:hypothetical protein LIA77_02225 [Sarocladium implicatum]
MKLGQKMAVSGLFLVACFPLLRPIAVKLLPSGSLSSYGQKTYGPSGQGYHLSGNSYPTSRQRSRVGKVSAIVRSRPLPGNDASSSTHELADMNQGLSFESADKSHDGVQTIITGAAVGDHSDREQGVGIMVHNDTVVEVEQRI